MNSLEANEFDAAPEASPNRNPSVDSGPGFVRLKTRQKKLLRKALHGGLTREKALEVVQALPIVKGLLPDPYGIQAANPYPSGLVECVRIGLAAESAGTSLTSEQMTMIKEAIIDVTVEQSGSQKPQFEGCVARRGWLLVTCSNSSTSEWFKQNFCHIQSKVTTKLKLMDESELPRRNVVLGYFPDSLTTSSQKVLEIIQAQNPVSTAEWRVMNRLTHGELLHLSMAVDNESHKKLIELNGTISFRFGRVKLCLKNSLDRKSVLNGRKETSPNRKSLEKAAISREIVPTPQEPVITSVSPWNQSNNPWISHSNPRIQWNQQQMLRYDPYSPRELPPNFLCASYSGSVYGNEGDRRLRPRTWPENY
ncbi:uncharacterized protein LOC6730216 [Drosophila simulans]|uniref:GD17134 n=1 Tax=Drosophila simulans TaxID=7240 RepID=B4R1L4_DROSI|nr:uncharacterized protein LOC6730216 [Drosophila simulans]EDX15002.1 GD17134 [Drosophila simulans]KMZ06835.1 uncharacterized protein Dsimw501_GD17134 [Drosophila simulans]